MVIWSSHPLFRCSSHKWQALTIPAVPGLPSSYVPPPISASVADVVLTKLYRVVQSSSQRLCITGRPTPSLCQWQLTPQQLQTSLLAPHFTLCPSAMLMQLWPSHPLGKQPSRQPYWLVLCWLPIIQSSARPEGHPRLPGPQSSARSSSLGCYMMVGTGNFGALGCLYSA